MSETHIVFLNWILKEFETLLGGLGLNSLDGGLIVEEFAYGCTGIGSALTITDIGVSGRKHTQAEHSLLNTVKLS